MPLATFATCPRCQLEVELTDLPAPIADRLNAQGPPLCGRCGRGDHRQTMQITYLWPVLLTMRVAETYARASSRRGAA